MSYIFNTIITAGYQERTGKCKICTFNIKPGERIIIGNGFNPKKKIGWHWHAHPECFIKQVTSDVERYFMNHQRPPEKALCTQEQRKRLRHISALIYYYKKSGGEKANEEIANLEAERKQIRNSVAELNLAPK